MPDRTIRVSLILENGRYVQGTRESERATQQLRTELGRIGTSLSTFGAGLGRMGRQIGSDMGSVARSMGLVFGAVEAAAISTSARFNQAVSGVAAVAGASAEQMTALRDAALDAGAETVFTAREAAQAEGELARANVSVDDVLSGGLIGSLNLAAAGQLGLADSATIAAQAMNIFHLRGEDVGHIADVLAAGANKSAAGVADLGEGMSNVGAIVANAGVSLEDTVGVLALLADNAVVGAEAGTGLRSTLVALQSPTQEAQTAMDDLGIAAYDAQGNFVGLADLAGQLHEKLGGLTQQQRDAALSTIFGTYGLRVANVLYQAGADKVREYTAAVNDQDAAQRTAATQMDNLAGDVEQLSGSLETGAIRIGDLTDGLLRAAAQGATGLVNAFNTFAQGKVFDRIGDQLDGLVGDVEAASERLTAGFEQALGRLSVADIDRIADGFGRARQAVEGLEPVLAGVGAAFGSMALRSLPIIGQFAPAISPITGVLAGLLATSDESREAVAGFGRSLGRVASNEGPALMGALGDLAGQLSIGLAGALNDLGPAIEEVAGILGPVLVSAIDSLGPGLADLIEQGGRLAAEVLPELAGILSGVAPLASVVGDALSAVADVLGLVADHADVAVPALVAVGSAFAAMKIARAVQELAAFKAVMEQIAVQKALGAMEGVSGAALNVGAAAGTARVGVGSLFGAVTSLNPILIGLGATVAIGTKLWQDHAQAEAEAKQRAQEYASAIREAGDAVQGTNEQLLRYLSTSDNTTAGLATAGVSFDELQRGVNGTDEQYRAFIASLRASATAAGMSSDEALALAVNIDVQRQAALAGKEANENLDNVLGDQAQIAESAAAAHRGMADAIDSASNAIRRLYGEMTSAEDADRSFHEASDRLLASIAQNTFTLDANTEAGRANADQAQQLGSATAELIAQRYTETGSVADATQAGLLYVESLKQQWRQAGLNEDQIAALVAQMHLTPREITTMIQQVGGDAAADFLERYHAQIDDLPDDAQTWIHALIDNGELGAAERALDDLTRPRTVSVRISTSGRLEGSLNNPALVGEHRAGGGLIPGSGDGDTVAAMLTPGEFVLRKEAVRALGVPTVERMNRLGFAAGGLVEAGHAAAARRAGVVATVSGGPAGQAAILAAGPGVDASGDINRLADAYAEVADRLGEATAQEILWSTNSVDGFQLVADGAMAAADAMDEAARAQADLAADHERRHDVMFAVGDLSADQYLDMLKGRLAALEAAGQKYSEEWFETWQDIDRITSDAAQAQQERLDQLREAEQRAFEQRVSDLSSAYLRASDEFAKAQEAYASAWTERNRRILDETQQFRDDIVATFRSVANPVDIFGSAADVTASGVEAALRHRVAAAQQFAATYAQLSSRGIDQSVLTQLAQKGPESLGLANALLKVDPQLVNEALATTSQLGGQVADVALGWEQASIQQKVYAEVAIPAVESFNDLLDDQLEMMDQQAAAQAEAEAWARRQITDVNPALAASVADVRGEVERLNEAWAASPLMPAPAGGSSSAKSVSVTVAPGAFTAHVSGQADMDGAVDRFAGLVARMIGSGAR